MSADGWISLADHDWMTVQEFCEHLYKKKWACRVVDSDSEKLLPGEARLPAYGVVYAYPRRKADVADFLALTTVDSLSAFAESHDDVADAVPIEVDCEDPTDPITYSIPIYIEEGTDSKFQMDIIDALMSIEGAEYMM